MGWTHSGRARWWRLAILVGVVSLGLTRSARAIYLDEDQTINLRTRIYSQGTMRTDNSGTGTEPATKAGQIVQNRNFFNPELDAKLTSHLSWMKGTFLDAVAPDDLSGRVAAWGFYDGIYDYGSGQFHNSASKINSTFTNDPVNNQSTAPKQSWYLEGPNFNGGGGKQVSAIFPGYQIQNPHDIYASQRRVNELYLNYTKGPVFVRVGKQAISWGESDTIALLDQNNPFDVTLGAPGVFEDLDEARIPLWTLRASYNLFDTAGPFSSAFVEGYWVPGDLDVNTGTLPLLTASPYSPRGSGPQASFPTTVQALGQTLNIRHPAQGVLLDQTPRSRFGNSRWGVRLQALVNRTHTLSTWYYTHFPNAPVPRGGGTFDLTNGTAIPTTAAGGGNRLLNDCGLLSAISTAQCVFVTETVHRMTGVIGASDTFFLEPLDGIVRAEAEFFLGEPSFVPEKNLSITNNGGVFDPLLNPGTVPRADYLRWELGFDRFFFARFLNPSNSFVWVTAMVGSYNLSENSQTDYRQNGQFKIEYFSKPAGTSPKPDDFVQQKTVEIFGQTHLGTDYLHGRLSPGITLIQSARGTYAILPDVVYRWRDWMLFEMNLVHIGGDYQQLGFFRDRGQIWLRATYQLN